MGQAKPTPKQLNPKGWAMQEDPKSSGCPTKPGVPEERPVLWGKASAQPIFESRAVYIGVGYRPGICGVQSGLDLDDRKDKNAELDFVQILVDKSRGSALQLCYLLTQKNAPLEQGSVLQKPNL